MSESILKKQLRESEALVRFGRWWIGQLKSMVPRKVQRYFYTQRRCLLIDVEDGASRLLLSTTNSDERLLGVCDVIALVNGAEGAFEDLRQLRQQIPPSANGVDVVVRLPESVFLTHETELPLATEANLPSVLRFELDRITPFPQGQARFGFEVIARRPERDKIRVRIAAIKQSFLDSLLEKLSAVDLTVSVVIPPVSITGNFTENDFPGPVSENTLCSPWNLLPLESRPEPEPLWTRQNRNFAALTTLLLLAVVILPDYYLTQKITELNEEISAIENHAREVSRKQALLRQKTEVGAMLIRRKNSEFAKLDIIRDLTRLIGDDTWITNMNVKGKTVNLSGESRQASVLIELLEQSPRFQNVTFESPVTRNTITDKERFEIKLELVEGDVS